MHHRDNGYTHSHSQRVARYAGELAKAVGMSERDIQTVRTAGVLHDVGKIGISDVLLLKPSGLTDEEFATMRRHSELGRDIIAGAGMDDIAEYVLHRTNAGTAGATRTGCRVRRFRSRAGCCTRPTPSRP